MEGYIAASFLCSQNERIWTIVIHSHFFHKFLVQTHRLYVGKVGSWKGSWDWLNGRMQNVVACNESSQRSNHSHSLQRIARNIRYKVAILFLCNELLQMRGPRRIKSLSRVSRLNFNSKCSILIFILSYCCVCICILIK